MFFLRTFRFSLAASDTDLIAERMKRVALFHTCLLAKKKSGYSNTHERRDALLRQAA
jgi:hypothetical protein